ncbi:MAG: thioredoxin fold domain-containing protein [Akkermansiaceae bacterium]
MNVICCRFAIWSVMCGSGLILCSCSQQGDRSQPSAGAFHGLQEYRRAGGRISGMDQTAPARVGQPSASEVGGVRVAGITPEEDIVWAPEDPDEAIDATLEDLWKSPENKSWHQSYVQATQQSRQKGRALLIWFTDSLYSPTCRHLSEEVFSTPDFEQWAAEHIIRLRVDKRIPGRERSTDLGVRKMKYIEKLINRYGVKGCPTVILLRPGGEVHASYRGYKKGDGEYYWARMKQAVITIDKGYAQWREKYQKRGYRVWTNRDGRQTFAKLYRYRDDMVTLVDPDGKKGKTSFSKLSGADQAWILLEKKKHQIRGGG